MSPSEFLPRETRMAVCLAAVPLLCLLLLLSNCALGQISACIAGISNQVHFQKEGLQYVPVSPSGHQVIIPSMKFTCYGYVANWSAIAVLDKTFLFLSYHIHFQIWRQVAKSKYHRVGSDYLVFPSHEINIETSSSTDTNIGFFEFQEKVGEGDSRIYFRPGDIVGYFVSPRGGSSLSSLGISFRSAAPTDNTSVIVDQYDYLAQEQLCEISECARIRIVYGSVIPQVSANVVIITPGAPVLNPTTQRDCAVVDRETCSSSRAATATTPGIQSSVVPTTPGKQSLKIPALAWVVGIPLLACMVICGVTTIVLAGHLVRQRRRNPTYTLNSNRFATASNQLPADHELVRVPRMTGNVLGSAGHLTNSMSFSNTTFQESEAVRTDDENHQLHNGLHTPEVACEQTEQHYVINVLQPSSDAQCMRITEL